MESADIEACTKIGAIIGNSTEEEVEALGKYGELLGTIFLLREDLMHSFNFSVQLKDKLIQGAYPFPVLWAVNNSEEFQHFLDRIEHKKKVTPHDVKRCVQLLFNSGAVDYIVTLMEEKAEDAVNLLRKVRESDSKKKLELIVTVQPQMILEVVSNER
jgi:geranylgeranyl pyrophosphate synthase